MGQHNSQTLSFVGKWFIGVHALNRIFESKFFFLFSSLFCSPDHAMAGPIVLSYISKEAS